MPLLIASLLVLPKYLKDEQWSGIRAILGVIPMSSQEGVGSAHLSSSCSSDEFDRDSLRFQWQISQAALDLIGRFFERRETLLI